MELLTPEEFLPWTLLLIAPLTVLAVCAAAAFLSAPRRRFMGILLITFGVFELVFLAGTIQANLSGGFGVPLGMVASVAVGAATFVSGIVSLTRCSDPQAEVEANTT